MSRLEILHTYLILSVQFNLGKVLLAQGLEASFDAFSRSLQIRQRKMPSHHYTGLPTFHKLGILVRERGDLPAASEFFRQALRILRASECHPGACARASVALSDVLTQLGEFEEAAEAEGVSERYRMEIADTGVVGVLTTTCTLANPENERV